MREVTDMSIHEYITQRHRVFQHYALKRYAPDQLIPLNTLLLRPPVEARYWLNRVMIVQGGDTDERKYNLHEYVRVFRPTGHEIGELFNHFLIAKDMSRPDHIRTVWTRGQLALQPALVQCKCTFDRDNENAQCQCDCCENGCVCSNSGEASANAADDPAGSASADSDRADEDVPATTTAPAPAPAPAPKVTPPATPKRRVDGVGAGSRDDTTSKKAKTGPACKKCDFDWEGEDAQCRCDCCENGCQCGSEVPEAAAYSREGAVAVGATRDVAVEVGPMTCYDAEGAKLPLGGTFAATIDGIQRSFMLFEPKLSEDGTHAINTDFKTTYIQEVTTTEDLAAQGLSPSVGMQLRCSVNMSVLQFKVDRPQPNMMIFVGCHCFP